MNDTPKCRQILLWLIAICALLIANSARADVRCYMLIFSAQTHPKVPRFTHTFCTIVRVADAMPGCPAPSFEAYTISWLPQTLKVRPYRLHDEPGRNLTLAETLAWSYRHHMRVSEWGPYAIEPCFFDLVFREYARIERGEFRYKAIDPHQRGARTTDCIHAVTDIDHRDGRATFSPLRSGDADTRKFVRILRERGRLMIPAEDISWLDAALGLDRYPILHRPNP